MYKSHANTILSNQTCTSSNCNTRIKERHAVAGKPRKCFKCQMKLVRHNPRTGMSDFTRAKLAGKLVEAEKCNTNTM